MREKVKLQARLHQQLNKNNKGSSLVTVLLVASIIAALVTVVLAVVILNVFMKKADLEGQSTFYDAESALEEIRSGLAKEESDATTSAYLDTLSNYANLKDDIKTSDEEDDSTLDAKTDNFNKEFKDIIVKSLSVNGDNKHYNPAKLTEYLRETKFQNGVGAEVLTATEDAHIDVTKEGVKLYNVQVKYTDANKYVSQIKTDIVLEYPPIDFQNASSIDNILTYGLIANKTFDPGATVDITGNAYIGSEGVEMTATNVTFNANGTQETNVISGDDIKLSGAKLNTNNVDLWTDNIFVDKSSEYNMNSGSAYIKDDIVLGNNSKATLKGKKLIMFGNPWVAVSDMVTVGKVKENAHADPPSYSSSILVTGSEAGLDMSGLDTMVIGGSAYIDSAAQNGKNGISGNKNIVTGQSLALKSDQRAYLVPPTLVGVREITEGNVITRTENYKNGLSNPMTGSQFQKLQEEIIAANNYDSVSDIKPTDYVAMNTAEPTLGMSLNGFVNAIWEQAHAGVSHDSLNPAYYPTVNICYYPSRGGSLVYLFIEFKTIGVNYSGEQNRDYIPAEAQYNRWYQLYNSSIVNYTKLLDNLNNYYATKGIKLPTDVGDKTKMYYTGNILTTEPQSITLPANQTTVILSDSITDPGFTMDLNVAYSRQSAYYQDAYYTLNKNLSTRPVTLSGLPESNSLFQNIVRTTAKIGDKTYTLPSEQYFVSPTGEAAVVRKGDYTYNSTNENNVGTTEDLNGVKHPDAKINVIIATGNVTVEQNFEGMIIAGGTVTVNSGNKVIANSDKASKALIATAYGDENDSAANYVINASKYLVGGTADRGSDSSDITMKNFVTYRNWTKQ